MARRLRSSIRTRWRRVVVDGLFAAGEVLDIDGRSGGFNLHWAWASGIVAGEAAAHLAMERAAER